MIYVKKLPYSEDCRCPKCGAECPDEEYFVDGQKYPQSTDTQTIIEQFKNDLK